MAKTKSKKQVQHAHTTGRHHLDRRAGELAAVTGDVDSCDDDLLTTKQIASWLNVSTEWLEIGRSKNYGPPFQRLGPAMIRYRRGAIKEWLLAREHKSTAEYIRSDGRTGRPRIAAEA